MVSDKLLCMTFLCRVFTGMALVLAFGLCSLPISAGQTSRALFFSAGSYCIYQVDTTRVESVVDRDGITRPDHYPVIDRGRSDWSHPVETRLPPGRYEFVAVYDPPPDSEDNTAAKWLRYYYFSRDGSFTVEIDSPWLLGKQADLGSRTRDLPARLTSECRGVPFLFAAEVDETSPTIGFLSFVPERRPRLPADNPAEQWLSQDAWLRDFTTARVEDGELNSECGVDAACETPREKPEVRRDYWLMTTELSQAMARRYYWLQSSGLPPGVITADLNRSRIPHALPQTADSPYQFSAAKMLLLPDDFPAVKLEAETARRLCRWLGGRLPTEREWRIAAQADGAGEFGAPLTAASPLCERGNFQAMALLGPCGEWKELKAAWERQLAARDVPGLNREDYADAARLAAARNKWLRIAPLPARPDWRFPPESDEGEQLREQYCNAHETEDADFCAAWRELRSAWDKKRARRSINDLTPTDYRDPQKLQSARKRWMRRFRYEKLPPLTGFWKPGFDAAARDGICTCANRKPGLTARARFAPNAIGLYDMIGNADEFVTQPKADDSEDPMSRPDAAVTPGYAIGGNWLDDPFTQSFSRPAKAAQSPKMTTGFRCLFEKSYPK